MTRKLLKAINKRRNEKFLLSKNYQKDVKLGYILSIFSSNGGTNVVEHDKVAETPHKEIVLWHNEFMEDKK